MADGVLTIAELADLPSLQTGYADFFQEVLHPLGGAQQGMMQLNARGTLTDGRPFTVQTNVTCAARREAARRRGRREHRPVLLADCPDECLVGAPRFCSSQLPARSCRTGQGEHIVRSACARAVGRWSAARGVLASSVRAERTHEDAVVTMSTSVRTARLRPSFAVLIPKRLKTHALCPQLGQREKMRKLIATLLTSSVLVFGGLACDDNNGRDKVDEDDTNLGPGDGKDEVGPGR